MKVQNSSAHPTGSVRVVYLVSYYCVYDKKSENLPFSTNFNQFGKKAVSNTFIIIFQTL
jgi:hypothetical protein